MYDSKQSILVFSYNLCDSRLVHGMHSKKTISSKRPLSTRKPLEARWVISLCVSSTFESETAPVPFRAQHTVQLVQALWVTMNCLLVLLTLSSKEMIFFSTSLPRPNMLVFRWPFSIHRAFEQTFNPLF